MTTMAANGTLTPPFADDRSTAPATTSAKRKRSNSDDEPQVNGAMSSHDEQKSTCALPRQSGEDGTQTAVATIFDILVKHDTVPSIFDAIPDGSAPPPTPVPAHSGPKRMKLSAKSKSIRQKVQASSYSSPEEFLRDVEAAVSQIIAPLAAKEALQPTSGYAKVNPLSLDETRFMTGALAVQKMAKNLITSENRLKAAGRFDSADAVEAQAMDEKSSTNGVIEIKLQSDDEPVPEMRSVLTLWANAQGHRQLFSSLQKPAKAESITEKQGPSGLRTEVDVNLPIRDDLLPNMISTSRILHVDSASDTSKKRPPTIGERFQPPTTIPQLTPPKHPKHTTRGILTWEFPDVRAKLRRGSTNYTRENLSVGQWLGYRGVDSAQEPTSPEAKRKQRDRALSTGEAQPKLSEEARVAVEQAKEEALFRSVYSSFAPSHDDSAAIVPAQTKDMVWWNKVGEKKFRELFAVDPQTIDPELMMGIEDCEAVVNSELDEAHLQEAVNDYEMQEPFSLPETKEEKSQDDIDGILEDISDLLETLNSYQRIRNASLSSHSHNRTPSVTSQQATITTMSGSPTNPTSSEMDTYDMLKLQLAMMINQLPPYAVAKLNGDQLAELNITRNILVEGDNYRGVMEEDQLSRLAKTNVPTSHPTAPRVSSSSNQYSTSTPQYGRSTTTGQFVGARPTPQSYFSQQSGLARNPGMPVQRSATGQFQTPTTYGASTPRPAYGATQSYSQSASRPTSSTSSYGQTQQYHHSSQPPPKPVTYPQYYNNNVPHANSQSRSYSQQTPSSYQSRPAGTGHAQNASMYSYAQGGHSSASQSPHVRTASPLRTPQLQPSQVPPRPTYQALGTPSYGTPTAAVSNHQARPQYAANMNSASYNANGGAPSTPSGGGPTTGFGSSMSNQDQQLMAERQRAQFDHQTRTVQRPQSSNSGAVGT